MITWEDTSIRRNTVPVQLGALQIPYELAWNTTRTSALKGRCMTAWSKASPCGSYHCRIFPFPEIRACRTIEWTARLNTVSSYKASRCRHILYWRIYSKANEPFLHVGNAVDAQRSLWSNCQNKAEGRNLLLISRSNEILGLKLNTHWPSFRIHSNVW